MNFTLILCFSNSGSTINETSKILKKAKDEILSLRLEKGQKRRIKYCEKRLIPTYLAIHKILIKKHASMLILQQMGIPGT